LQVVVERRIPFDPVAEKTELTLASRSGPLHTSVASTNIVKDKSTGVPGARIDDVTVRVSCQVPTKFALAFVLFRFMPGGADDKDSNPVDDTKPRIDPNWIVPDATEEAEVLKVPLLNAIEASCSGTTIGEGTRLSANCIVFDFPPVFAPTTASTLRPI
jgi:hypothetical protein